MARDAYYYIIYCMQEKLNKETSEKGIEIRGGENIECEDADERGTTGKWKAKQTPSRKT